MPRATAKKTATKKKPTKKAAARTAQTKLAATKQTTAKKTGAKKTATKKAAAKPKGSGSGEKALRKHLLELLGGGSAHATFDDAVRNLPESLRGEVPKGGEHSPWQLLEHLRIAQWDILEFSLDARHKSPEWPSGYWPLDPVPPNAAAWDKSVRAFRADWKRMCALVENEATDLYAVIPHGTGQTLLREALLVADHNAYHVGQLVTTRRLLGAWPPRGASGK